MEGTVDLQDIKRVYPNILFFVERSMDSEVVVYNASCINGEMEINAHWTKADNLDHTEDIGQQAMKIFYASRLRKVPNTKNYQMLIAALPKRIVNLCIRESGRVAPKIVLNDAKGNKKECTILKIYVTMRQELVGYSKYRQIDRIWNA